MLDAYIIDRIQKERQRKDGGFIPLRVPQAPPPRTTDEKRDRKDEDDRGSVIIDFHV